MKVDWKKVKSVVLTYATLTLPLAIAAFSLDAPTWVKILTFISGLLAIVRRQMNPKDEFELAALTSVENLVKEKLAKAKK